MVSTNALMKSHMLFLKIIPSEYTGLSEPESLVIELSLPSPTSRPCISSCRNNNHGQQKQRPACGMLYFEQSITANQQPFSNHPGCLVSEALHVAPAETSQEH